MQKPQRKRWAAEAYCVPGDFGRGNAGFDGKALLAVFVFSMVRLIFSPDASASRKA
jgi:hypothetical protein